MQLFLPKWRRILKLNLKHLLWEVWPRNAARLKFQSLEKEEGKNGAEPNKRWREQEQDIFGGWNFSFEVADSLVSVVFCFRRFAVVQFSFSMRIENDLFIGECIWAEYNVASQSALYSTLLTLANEAYFHWSRTKTYSRYVFWKLFLLYDFEITLC